MTSMLRVALASVAVVILAWAIGHEGAGRAGDVPASVAASQPAEKLILGFEKAEIEHKKQGKTCWTVLENVEGGVDHWAPFEFGEVDRTWTWHCRSGDATEGKLSLLARTGTGAAFREFRATPITERYYPTLRTNSDAAVLLNTYQWLSRCGVGIADWSGYARLRADVRCQAATKIWLAVEDDEIEPPVVCTYAVPAGKWVTIELDLAQAVRDRRLALSRIANFWMLGNSGGSHEVRVDNIRIAQADAPATLEVLRDATPMALPEVKLPDPPVTPALPADTKADRSPVTLGEPVVVKGASLAPFGWISAFDNQHLLLGSSVAGKPTVRFSKDAGATWEVLAAPAVANLDHGTSRGSVVDERGDVTVVSSGNGCAGLGVASPRQMLSKYTFDGQTWQLGTPPAVLDCDMRHCASNACTVRLRSGSHAGRLWSVWGEVDRLRSLCVHAKFSDDDGQTWNLPGKGGLVPGSRESYFTFNAYGYQVPRCTPYGDGIAVFWQDARGLLWNRFEKGQWAQTEVIDASAAPDLAPTENEGFRVPGACVTRGESEVFLTAWKIPGVLRWDGKKWQRELPDACDGAVLSLCGGKDLMLFTAGATEQPPSRRRIEVIKKTPVLCYRRKADGSWDKPLDLSKGPTDILEYRQMTSVVAPPYAPANFCPVAWSSRETVKVVRVPVLPP